MAGFLPEITGEALGSFPLPEFEVFSVTGVTTGMAGGDAVEGYWMLRGDLEAGRPGLIERREERVLYYQPTERAWSSA